MRSCLFHSSSISKQASLSSVTSSSVSQKPKSPRASDPSDITDTPWMEDLSNLHGVPWTFIKVLVWVPSCGVPPPSGALGHERLEKN